jgi:hypothetical protein
MTYKERINYWRLDASTFLVCFLLLLIGVFSAAVFDVRAVSATPNNSTPYTNTSDPTTGNLDGEHDPSEYSGNGVLGQNDIWGLTNLIINILSALIGFAAIAGIVYGGVLYATSGDSADRNKKARSMIVNAVIGLIMFALLYSFLQYLIPGGVF